MLAGNHHAGTDRKTQQVDQHHAEAMINRYRNGQAIIFTKPQGLSAKIGIVENIVMAEQNRLGGSGGSRGVLNVNRVVYIKCSAE